MRRQQVDARPARSRSRSGRCRTARRPCGRRPRRRASPRAAGPRRRKVIVYASMPGSAWLASTVTMLESRPPDRKRGHRHVGHHVSGDRLLDDPAQVGAAARRRPRRPPRASRQYVSTRQLPSGRSRAQLPAGQLVARRRSRTAARAASSRASTRPARRARSRSSGAGRGDQRLQLGANTAPRPRGRKYSGLMPSGSRARISSPLRSSSIANANMPRNRRQRVRPPPPPGLEHHLGVRWVAEADAAGGQLGPQGLVVVQLAVVDDASARALLIGWSAASDRSMMDSRRWPSWTETRSSSYVVDPRSRPGRGARSGRS